MVRILLSLIMAALSSWSALASVPLNKAFRLEARQDYETKKLCKSCTHARVYWKQNLDPDDGALIDMVLIKFYKDKKLLFSASYEFDEVTSNRYLNSGIKDKFPFVRYTNGTLEGFIINTSGTKNFRLFRE